jgi:hypothetical protein
MIAVKIAVGIIAALAAILLLVRRDMGTGDSGARKASSVYMASVDCMTLALIYRSYSAFTFAVIDVGALILSTGCLLFAIGTLYDAISHEPRPSWWPLAWHWFSSN